MVDLSFSRKVSSSLQFNLTKEGRNAMKGRQSHFREEMHRLHVSQLPYQEREHLYQEVSSLKAQTILSLNVKERNGQWDNYHLCHSDKVEKTLKRNQKTSVADLVTVESCLVLCSFIYRKKIFLRSFSTSMLYESLSSTTFFTFDLYFHNSKRDK